NEWAEVGLISMESANDPKPSIKIEGGRIEELDGKTRDQFDSIDQFIADYGINVDHAEEAMKIDALKIARMLVDINVSREEIVKICTASTPAKLVEVVNQLNVVEIMMAQMKMRARKTPANQAHATNLEDNPVLIAADAAEEAYRGFAEVETTCAVARYAPFNAIALLVGAQTGRGGVLNQCSMEEATELELGMRGFTSYAETVSVYGTEAVFTDGGDTPWSKGFLASAYASRGIKMRYTSGTGSEVLMGNAEGKSMLYLEARCLLLTKACGVQGTQNGAINCSPLVASLPNGFRAIAGENLIASMLDIEVASGNDTTFTHSDIRRGVKLAMQMLPGTDFITSGYGGIPNLDNVFAGSNTDCDDYDDYYTLQRDMKVDGGIYPIVEEEAIAIRNKAAKALQSLFLSLGLPRITDEEVEAATYAYSHKDMPKRNKVEDIKAAGELMNRNVTGFDIVKALYENGYKEIAERVLLLLKQRVIGDYLHTSAIFDNDFKVLSAINNRNDYLGPGTGYKMDNQRWNIIKRKENALDPKNI
ncbi:MAG: propanediol/glycerol family dehydratase large subunit, partial [Clostridia bacterium]|nr:propanediol/glycerol family dehydratase large subunit [Clostridia bacterium]